VVSAMRHPPLLPSKLSLPGVILDHPTIAYNGWQRGGHAVPI
jgi:hypothetical protein